MKTLAAALACVGVLVLPARAAVAAPVISAAPDGVAVSIYHEGRVDTASLAQSGGNSGERLDGLALVSESRIVTLPAGPVDIQFRGVAGTMVPQTAHLDGLAVRQGNFDFDLLGPGSLIAKSVGQRVHRIRTARDGSQSDDAAIIRSGPDGVMLQIGDHAEALGCSGEAERIVFDRLPAGLLDTPTLSVHADAPRAGRYTLTLRYIATGLNWSADYVARLNRDGRTLDLSGWITLANFSQTSFVRAPVDVIAGHVATTGRDRPPVSRVPLREPACWPTNIRWASFLTASAVGSNLIANARAAPAPAPPGALESVMVTGTTINPRNLGEYKLYPLPQPTNVAAQQTKQVQFLDNHAVPFDRVYRIAVSTNLAALRSGAILPAGIVLKLRNDARGGLGKPLPAGGVSVFAPADGAPILIGQDGIDDVAQGLPLEIASGSTLAVRAEARLVSQSNVAGGMRRSVVEVIAINGKAAPAVFEWRQTMDTGMALASQTRPHGAKNGDLLWSLALKPGERVTFRYAIDRPV